MSYVEHYTAIKHDFDETHYYFLKMLKYFDAFFVINIFCYNVSLKN